MIRHEQKPQTPQHFESAEEAERNRAGRQVKDSRVVLGVNVNTPEAAA